MLPVGVEEILPPRAYLIEQARRSLIDLFDVWGYEFVMPPFIEYLESLLTGTGPDLDLQTFKLIDQLSGRSLGMRADMTPQVARIDAHSLRRDEPVRLCYLGTVLHTRPDGFSGSRSPIQVGAELYGHAGVESDCEIICLLLETLANSGIRDVHLDIGHMGVFHGLSELVGFEADDEVTLFDALQRKSRSEIEDLLSATGVEPSVSEMILGLGELNGGAEVLERAATVLSKAPLEVQESLQRLQSLAEALRGRIGDVSLHVDLAELRGYRYERGVVFAAFVPGHGQEIARGGRYDGIGEAFGHSRPAIGFSTDLKTLVALADPSTRSPTEGIFAPWVQDPGLYSKIRALRNDGERVVSELPGQSGNAGSMNCNRVLVLRDGNWEVESTTS